MRKGLILLIAVTGFLTAHSQRNFSLSASGNFSFLVRGLGTNNGAFGLTIQPNFFTKNKLQLRTEATLDQFLGSKIYMVDSARHGYDNNPAVLSFRAGSEFFITKTISLTALYGYVKYHWLDDNYDSGSFKFALTARAPRHPKMLIGFSYTKMTGVNYDVNFCGINLGFKIL